MKFGESLNDTLVPEWKPLYVDYKAGKKLIRKIAEAGNQPRSRVVSESPEATPGTPLLHDRNKHQRNHENEGYDATVAEGHDSFTDRSSSRGSTSGFEYKISNFNFSLLSKGKISKPTQEDFMEWLQKQLRKVDHFYKVKELKLYERFLILENQLFQLRSHKRIMLEERLKHAREKHASLDTADNVYRNLNDFAYRTKSVFLNLNRLDLPSLPSTRFLQRWFKTSHKGPQDHTNDAESEDQNFFENRIRNGYISNDSSSTDYSLESNETNPREDVELDVRNYRSGEGTSRRPQQDYVPRKMHFGVSYFYARKQLKDAMLEYYRSLALLKSYKVLNRTAFRKITKKADKILHTHISEDYVNFIDLKSYFLTSEILNNLITQVEDLYIVFFDTESKDRKQSLEKLKSISYALNSYDMKLPAYYTSTFFSGTFLGFGIPLSILALYRALDETIAGTMPEGKFLLQVWGGFFLILFVLILFGVALVTFDYFKINYKFIFEFDVTTSLNAKQFFLLPSFGFGLFSILIWFSFNNFWPESFPGRDWPWIFFGVMMCLFLWPGNSFYPSSRRWLQVALWRLLLSGFYPVEFRDFFLGDILSSLTYSIGNLPFFFCLYSHKWNGLLSDGNSERHNKCGSSKSRLMGFFSTLPSIWRLLQCFRRFADTGDWFPHLANMLKYGITIIYYSLLSAYRIDRSSKNRIIFIVFAILNSLYTSAWDIIMDWSLLQTKSKHFLLRDLILYDRPIYYYIAMIVDVLLRFQWIFYAFFTNQIQQLAVTSFLIAVAEIIRRCIWACFRMENEHCTNVTLFRASKDSPLPYPMPRNLEYAIRKLTKLKFGKVSEQIIDVDNTEAAPVPQNADEVSKRVSSSEVEGDLGLPPNRMPSKSLQRRSTFSNFTNALNKAHIKDFQRKTKVFNSHDLSEEDEDLNEADDVDEMVDDDVDDDVN